MNINETMIRELDLSNMGAGAALGDLQYAESFFPEKSIEEAAQPPSVVTSDSDGLINIMLLSPQVDENLQELLNEQKQNLIDLTGLGTAFVAKQAEKDSKKKYDIELWQQVFNHLPLMGPSKFTKQTYSKNVRGVEIAKTFIDFIMNSVIKQSPSLGDLQKFLANQGESIRLGTEKNKDSFQMGCICIVLETMVVGTETQLVPKIKAYFVKFTRENYKWTAACTSGENVDIYFEYQTAVSVFNYRALENGEVEKKFNDLIGKSQIEDITSSGNFFGAEGL